jgi:predicted metal-binding membrane protein
MTRQRSLLLPVAFTAGYLVTWAVAGAGAFALIAGVGRVSNNALAWDNAGRPVAGAILIVAALYQLTPLKDACLGKCRSPLGLLLGTWRDGPSGALRMGARNGAWCVGCCWALMASLFALGVMSVAWMLLVAGLITVEKTIPSRRIATYGTALVLLVLGVLVLAAPEVIPVLTIPDDGQMAKMPSMGS